MTDFVHPEIVHIAPDTISVPVSSEKVRNRGDQGARGDVDASEPDSCAIVSAAIPATSLFEADLDAQQARAIEHAEAREDAADRVACDAWVSTDLAILRPARPANCPEDLLEAGKAYRRLSPDHYEWLHAKFTAFRRARAGHDDSATRTFESRFAAVRKLAEALYAPDILKAARARLAVSAPPSPNADLGLKPQYARFLFPAVSDLPRSMPVTRYALAQVDAIRDAAVAAGWPEARLYQNRGRLTFPCGNDWGVVCFVHPTQRLGRVTARAIEVVCQAGHSLHFYRTGERP